jgi:hypothetical protein
MKGGLVGLTLLWTWYTLMLVGAYRLTQVGLHAVVRRVVRIASQATAELGSDRRIAAASDTNTAPPQAHTDAVGVSVVVNCGHHQVQPGAVSVCTTTTHTDRPGRLNAGRPCV